MILSCGRILASALSPTGLVCTFEREHLASEFAHGGSIRLLLLAYECHIKTKLHVVCGVLRAEL